MTNPLDMNGAEQPQTDVEHDPTEEEVSDHSQDEGDVAAEVNSKRYLVKTPWYCDLLQGNGEFPDVTPQGVEMTGEERQKAYEGAKVAGWVLKSKEVTD